MKPIIVHLPEHYIKALNELVESKKYTTRASAIRAAIRDLLKNEAVWCKTTKGNMIIGNIVTEPNPNGVYLETSGENTTISNCMVYCDLCKKHAATIFYFKGDESFDKAIAQLKHAKEHQNKITIIGFCDECSTKE